MNKIKKLSIMLVALVMCVVLGVTAWAAEDSNADFSALLSGESTLHVSDDQDRTVTVTVTAKAPVSIFSLDAAIIIPDDWSATVSSGLTGFTAEENYGDGRVAWYTGANVSATELLVITYTIPAETTGTFELGVKDLELGQLSGSGWNVVAQDVTVSTTLTINAHSDVDTDNNHSCDICNKGNVTAHAHKTYGKDDDNHWSICNCGETIANTTAGHTYDQDGDKCVCGAEKPVTNITVTDHTNGTVTCTVSGQVVTITHSIACRVGYWDATNSKYVALTATLVEGNTYSFTVPEGVTEVIVVIRGDANSDGGIKMNDATRVRAHFNSKVEMNDAQIFATDMNNDDDIKMNDATNIRAVFNSKSVAKWDV